MRYIDTGELLFEEYGTFHGRHIMHSCLFLSAMMSPELWFHRRCLNFITKSLNTKNQIVSYLTEMSRFGAYSVLGGNLRFLNSRYFLDQSKVNERWKALCGEMDEAMRNAEQIRELIHMRDYKEFSFLNSQECN